MRSLWFRFKVWHSISRTQPKIAKKLLNEVSEWKKNVLTELGKDTRPFIIGHSNYRWTQIPARDGITHGEIKRSGRAPNCSYFANWKSTDDKITWDCEVASTGIYEVSIHYALTSGNGWPLGEFFDRGYGFCAVCHEDLVGHNE